MASVNNYTQVRELSRGGQGIVKLCKNLISDDLCVTKMHVDGLSKALVGGNLSRQFDGIPFSVKVLDVLSDNTYVMPYYEDHRELKEAFGETAARRQVFIQEVCSVMLCVAIYLHRAKEAGCDPHGDISPSNVMIVDATGLVRSLDETLLSKIFSATDEVLTKILSSEGSLLQRQNVVVLDPWMFDASYDTGVAPVNQIYASPEHLDKGGLRDAASDVYSFGVMLWAALAGRRPPRGGMLPPIRESNRLVPAQFEQIVRGCVQGEKGSRLSTGELVRSMAWAVAYSTANGEFPYGMSESLLLPPRPAKIRKTFLPIEVLRICGRAVGVQQLSTAARGQFQRVVFETLGSADQYVVPQEVSSVADAWLTDCIKCFAYKRRETLWNSFFDGEQVRVKKLSERAEGDVLRIALNTGYTTFFNSQRTNYFCNRFLESGRLVWQDYGGRERSLEDSRLSNPLAFNFLVITSDEKIAVARRSLNLSTTVAADAGSELPLVCTVSGTCEPSSCCSIDGSFSLEKAIAVEYEEEVLNGHILASSQIVSLGVARTNVFLWPFVYGFIVADKSSDELRRGSRVSEKGLVEVDSFEFVEDRYDAIAKYIREGLNVKRDPHFKVRKIEESLVFCLYRYAQWRGPTWGVDASEIARVFECEE